MGIELLAPAGSYESVSAAFAAGADAVYVGGSRFGARAYAKNLDEEHLKRAIEEAHLRGKKLYLTVNTLLKDRELEDLYGYLLPLYREGLDAVIVQDLGVLRYIRDVFPGLLIHASTQTGVTGAYGARLLEEAGARRVVTARELSLPEIAGIRRETGLEIESFIHGALCFCYSGQCLLSSMLGGRSGNRGRCAQPCRLPWDLYRSGKPANGKNRRFLLSPKDICTLDILPLLIKSGVDSLKIEGRMKSAEYAAGVTRIYRYYLDLYLLKGEASYRVKKEHREELLTLFNRMGFSEGYSRQHNGPAMMASARQEHPDVRLEHARQAEREALAKTLRENYTGLDFSQKINGKLMLSCGKSAILSVTCKDQTVTVTGQAPQRAKSRPLTKEDAARQLGKTGGSGFAFAHLETEMEDGLFLPVQALNELRRDALSKLKQSLLKNSRRKDGVYREPEPASKETKDADQPPYLAVSLENLQSFSAILKIPEAAAVYLDCSAFDRKTFPQTARKLTDAMRLAKKRSGYILPWIFRDAAQEYYKEKQMQDALRLFDVLLIRNQEEYIFLKTIGYGGTLLADWNLYTFNREARRFWKERDAFADTAPPELNRRELAVRGLCGSELMVYGYQPLMVSAQCQIKNTCGCTKKPQVLYLADRKKKYFAVKNYCDFCYNIIYNSTPLLLLTNAEEIRKLAPSGIRLAFTLEDALETKRTVWDYVQAFLYGKQTRVRREEFTRGHFERGVE